MSKFLIVVDMQNDFVDGALGTPEAEAIVDDVANYARNFDGTVVFTYDTHHENYLSTQEGKKLPVPHCIKGTDGWALNPKLDNVRRSLAAEIFEKPTFGSTALAAWLVDQNEKSTIESIELCGLCTDICVVSNALLIKASLPEVAIKVQAHLCAGVTPAAHEAALSTMGSCQVEVSE